MIKSEVQAEISAAMRAELTDVAYFFNADGTRGDPIWNPKTETSEATQVAYSGLLIGGLSFTETEAQQWQVDVKDQKCIIMQNETNGVPEVGDHIEYRDLRSRVVNIGVIPANVGWVLQLRRV